MHTLRCVACHCKSHGHVSNSSRQLYGNEQFWQKRFCRYYFNVVMSETVNQFKNRLDKFWSNQDLIYNYKAELTGKGNRSSI